MSEQVPGRTDTSVELPKARFVTANFILKGGLIKRNVTLEKSSIKILKAY